MTSSTQSIDALLARLGSAIRRYVLLEGLGLLLVLACTAFWVTFGIDWLHFQMRRLELPLAFRALCTMAIAAVLAIAGLTLLARLFRGLRSRSLALVLERRFPELNDRLITAVELGLEKSPRETPLGQAMYERTSAEASSLTQSLDLGSVFDQKPLRRTLGVAGVLVATVAVFGVMNVQAMERWIDAYLLGKTDYWNRFRLNQLEIRLVTQPGDRVREFSSEGIYKHPRGGNLEFQVISRDGHPVPDRVSLETASFSGTTTQRSRVDMQRIGDAEFRHRIDNVIHDLQVRITGGDFTNRRQLRVRIVDPPRVDQIQLACDYPAYTGMDSLEDKPVVVASTQVSLPLETRFDVVGETNKPLARVHMRTTRFDLSFEAQPIGKELRLTVRDRESDAPRSVVISAPPQPLVNADRRGFRVPLWITGRGDDLLDGLVNGAEFPIPIPAGEAIQIYLEDEDDIYSPDPAMFLVNGIVDQPPVVDTKLRGVRNKVTRMATIPIEGRIVDDYGVSGGTFSWVVDQGQEPQQESQQAPLHVVPTGQKEFLLKAAPEDTLERFQLLPLTLMDGQTLSLAVEAVDGDDLNGPHSGRGQPFAFTIVSTDELLAALYDDEINLRLRFEHIYEEVRDLRQDLQTHVDQLSGTENLEEIRRNMLAFAERSLHGLRKNHTESRAVEISFQDMREEMVNNHIETRELMERINQGILQPLNLLNEQDFIAADEGMGQVRRIAERGGDLTQPAQAARTAIDGVLSRMETILAEMRDRSSDQQLIQLLQELIEGQEKLMQETEDKGLEEKFFQLGN